MGFLLLISLPEPISTLSFGGGWQKMATLGCFFDFDGSYDLQKLEFSQNRHHHRMPHQILCKNRVSRLCLQPIMASLIEVYNRIRYGNLRLPLCLSPSVLFRRWILARSCFFFWFRPIARRPAKCDQSAPWARAKKGANFPGFSVGIVRSQMTQKQP